MANFKPEQTIEEMLAIMNKNDGNTETIYAGTGFIHYKLQEKLLEAQEKRHIELLNNQNDYNSKQVASPSGKVYYEVIPKNFAEALKIDYSFPQLWMIDIATMEKKKISDNASDSHVLVIP